MKIENVPKEIKVYNLVDSNGNKLQLVLGIKGDPYDEYPMCTADKGFRWKFIGTHIPMPVRSDYWFNGFPDVVMLDWLKANGWYPKTCVDMCTGRAVVYELPKANELTEDLGHAIGSRVNAYLMSNELDACTSKVNEETFHYCIRELWGNGSKLKAVRLYRYAHGGSLAGATNAVKAICGEA